MGIIVALVALSLPAVLPASSAVADTHSPVVVIMMENHSFGPDDPGVQANTTRYIVGNPDAPYINDTLIPAGTLYTNYDALGPVSLPNYLDLTAGTDGGCATDDCPRDSFPQDNVFHLLGEAGLPFASLIGSMPGNCPARTTYASLKHNPEAYFTDVDAASALAYDCPVTDVPLRGPLPNPLPDFTFISPNNCDNMHGGSKTSGCPGSTDALITAGDTWLSQEIPALQALGATVVVTFDEGAELDLSGGGGHVPTIVVGPDVEAGVTNDTPLDHFGLLAGIERDFGLSPLLGAAATATPIQLPDGLPPPAPTLDAITPSSGSRGSTVQITGASLGTTGSVSFGGVAASFTIAGDGEVDAIVPAGATGGPVSVSTRGGSIEAPFDVQFSGPSLVQHASAPGISAGPSATLHAPTLPGDLLVVAVAWKGTPVLTAPAGWNLMSQSGTLAIYALAGAPAQDPTVTFSLSSSSKWVMQVSEWSGLGLHDVSAKASSGASTGTLASTGATASTAQPIELAIGAISAMAAVSESGPTGGSEPLDLTTVPKDLTLGTFWDVTSSMGPQGTSVTLSSAAKWRGVVATFG